MNRKSERQPLLARQVLPIAPGVPALVPLQALPVAPREAIPTTTTPSSVVDMLCAALSQKDEEIADLKGGFLAAIQHYGAQHATRTGRARRAGSAPKTKIAGKHAEMVERWAATMDYQMEHGGRTEKGYIDRLVAERFQVHYKTVERARMKAGYK